MGIAVIVTDARLKAKLRKARDLRPMEAAVELSARAVQVEARSSMRHTSRGQPVTRYKPRRVHAPSLPGNPPAIDQGRLRDNIVVQRLPGGLTASITVLAALVPYAVALEFGTTTMAARPFLFPAVEATRRVNVRRIGKAFRNILRTL